MFALFPLCHLIFSFQLTTPNNKNIYIQSMCSFFLFIALRTLVR